MSEVKWKEKSLGNLSTFRSGGTPSKSNPNFWDGNIPWVTAKDMKVPVINSSIDKLTMEGRKVAKLAPENTLLILVRGMTLHKDIPLAVTGRELAFNQDIKALSTCEEILPIFLMLYLSSQKSQILKLVESAGHGTGRLDTNILKSLLIRYPPILEQKKIIDTLSVWQNAIEGTESLISVKDKLFDWLQKNLIKNDFMSCHNTLSDYASISKKEKILSADGESLLTVKLHCKGIEKNNRDMKVILSSKGRPYYKRSSGEFLIGRQNFHNGGFGIVPPKLDGFISSSAITTLEIEQKNLIPEYLFFHFSRKNYYLRIGHIMDGTGQKELSDKQIMKLPISAPPIDIQKNIILKLGTAKKELNLLKDLLEKYRTQKRGLMQKLLTGEWQVNTPPQTIEEKRKKVSV